MEEDKWLKDFYDAELGDAKDQDLDSKIEKAFNTNKEVKELNGLELEDLDELKKVVKKVKDESNS